MIRLTTSHLIILVAGLCCPALSDGSDFVDTRLTITFGDDDVQAKAGESAPDSPLPGFGDRPGYKLMFDALNSRYSGRETLTNLALYRKLPGFFPRLTTEAMFLMLIHLDHGSSTNVALMDTGSYIRLNWALGGYRNNNLSLTAFPFDSDRFRLGHLYAISVGGTGTYLRSSWIGAPGAKLELDVGLGTYFVGMKAIPSDTASDANQAQETIYSVLGGAAWDLLGDTLRLDVAAGYFAQGENPLPDVAGASVYALGGSGRVVYRHGLAIEESIDLTLYRNDPNRPFLFFRPVQYRPGEIAWLVSLEATALAQRLGDPARLGALMFQPAIAGALQARMQHGMWRHEVTIVYQDLPFLLHTTPGFVPHMAFSPDMKLRPEVLTTAATDYFFTRDRLTLGVAAGVMWPASLRATLTGTALGSTTPITLTDQVVVISDASTPSILPQGDNARPLLHARLQARVDLSQMLYAVAWFQARYDPNRTVLAVNPDLTSTRVYSRAGQYGIGASAAVRF